MSEQTSEALRAWFKRVEPCYPELFNTAHVITGSYDLAEYALRSALMDVYLQTAEGGMALRERLRASVREEAAHALQENGGTAEFTWSGFADSGEPLARLAAQQSIETQRTLMLRYGVGYTPGRIAKLTGASARRVREQLNRFELRCRRRQPDQARTHFDAQFAEIARRQLISKTGVPHPSGIYRAFEAEAYTQQMPQHRLSQFIYHAVLIVMALICAALFWLFAVLVQPPTLEPAEASAPTAATGSLEPDFNPESVPRVATTYATESPRG